MFNTYLYLVTQAIFCMRVDGILPSSNVVGQWPAHFMGTGDIFIYSFLIRGRNVLSSVPLLTFHINVKFAFLVKTQYVKGTSPPLPPKYSFYTCPIISFFCQFAIQATDSAISLVFGVIVHCNFQQG